MGYCPTCRGAPRAAFRVVGPDGECLMVDEHGGCARYRTSRLAANAARTVYADGEWRLERVTR